MRLNANNQSILLYLIYFNMTVFLKFCDSQAFIMENFGNLCKYCAWTCNYEVIYVRKCQNKNFKCRFWPSNSQFFESILSATLFRLFCRRFLSFICGIVYTIRCEILCSTQWCIYFFDLIGEKSQKPRLNANNQSILLKLIRFNMAVFQNFAIPRHL